jgi:hypothetical protein
MRERDIKHEAATGSHWVLDAGDSYAVMVVGATHSESESAYARTPDGLSLAIARCGRRRSTPISQGARRSRSS